MKQCLLSAFCAVMAAFAAFAVEDVVTVKASVETTAANSRAKNECKAKAQKLAVEKYLGGLDAGMAETLVKKAVQDYKKYVDEVEADDGDFEDGEYSCEYKITIKREELLQWLGTQGWNMSAAGKDASGSPVEIELVIAEQPPSVGTMKVADAMGTGLDGKAFFFTQYSEFQDKIQKAITKQLNNIGIQVPQLADNPAYADLKDQDPHCLGVYFDPGVGDKGDFKITKNYLQTIQSNNPDTLVLYYHISSLIFEADQRKAQANVTISIKNLKTNKTVEIGEARNESPTITSKQQDVVMAEMAETVRRCTNKILNGEDSGKLIMNTIKTLMAEAAKPQGPMKVVFNMTNVDKKIRTKAKVMLKKGLIAAGLTDQKNVKTVGDTLTMTVTKKDIPDMDELWVAIMEVLMSDDVGIGEATDDQKTVNGNTMTVTPGKETSGE